MVVVLASLGFRTRSGSTPDGWCPIYLEKDIVGAPVAEYVVWELWSSIDSVLRGVTIVVLEQTTQALAAFD